MTPIPYKDSAYQLLHGGALALAELECNGMAVDEEYVGNAIKRVAKKVTRMQAELETTDEAKVWKETFKGDTNFGSNDQLATVLFEKLGFTCTKTTAGGKFATDEDELELIDSQFVRDYLEVKKIIKGGTVLEGIQRETVNGRVHGFFNLHIARTFRSSMNDPNLQNVPIRDPYIGPLVRQAFVASPGRQLVEVDFKGAEVCVGACYHKDANMIAYILDKSKDMHRDAAMELFKLPLTEFLDGGKSYGKEIRHRAKNMWVFPQFYGSWSFQCAPNLWKDTGTLKLRDGTLLIDHLRKNGIKELGSLDYKEKPKKGTFVHHATEMEKVLWGTRFKTYAQWKREFYAEYQQRTWFETFTGFICQGYMDRKQVANYPIQGSSFHCLLWCLIQIVKKELRKREMNTFLVSQVHDSMLADVVPEELDEYLGICHRVITKLLRQWAPWLAVPIDVEYEVSPVGGSWAEKKGYHFNV